MIYAQGPDNPPAQTVTYMIHRVQADGSDILFINVICFEKDKEKLEKVAMNQKDARSVTVDVTYNGVSRTHSFEIGRETV